MDEAPWTSHNVVLYINASNARGCGCRAGRLSSRDRRFGEAVQRRAKAGSVQRLVVCVSQSVVHGVENLGFRRPRILALPQTPFQRTISMVADRQRHGGEDVGGPSVAGSSFSRQSRSHTGRTDMAARWSSGLTRPLFPDVHHALNRSCVFWAFVVMLRPRKANMEPGDQLSDGFHRRSLLVSSCQRNFRPLRST